MQIKLLKDVVSSIAGPAASGIVDLLYGKKNVNEFLIAKKLKLNINQARNMLYKLVDAGLVSFIRKKDKKNGGWYTYYWTLDVGKSLYNLKQALLKDMAQLESQIALRKKKTYYYCPNCDVEMDDENALLNNFTCPECGEVFVLRDSTDIVTKLQETVDQRKKQLELVETELGSVEHKEGILKRRRMNLEVKKKKVARALKKAARNLEKKAAAPKAKPKPKRKK